MTTACRRAVPVLLSGPDGTPAPEPGGTATGRCAQAAPAHTTDF